MAAAVNTKGDIRIIAELERIRERMMDGDVPARERGLMYFDFEANKVRIEPIKTM